jgi:hypothetical protein
MKTAEQKTVQFEIVDADLFNQKVIDVDTSGLTNNGTDIKGNHLGFEGSISIEKEDGKGWTTTTGYFGSHDYKTELGFILVYK